MYMISKLIGYYKNASFFPSREDIILIANQMYATRAGSVCQGYHRIPRAGETARPGVRAPRVLIQRRNTWCFQEDTVYFADKYKRFVIV